MTLREQRRKIWYCLKKSSKPLFKRVEIVTSLESVKERQFSIEMSRLRFQVWSKKWGNKSHCSISICIPEHRHIQGTIPILMPSGKASCTNCSDEAEGSQSFNVQLDASRQYTRERLTFDMAFEEDQTWLHSANLSCQDYIFI